MVVVVELTVVVVLFIELLSFKIFSILMSVVKLAAKFELLLSILVIVKLLVALRDNISADVKELPATHLHEHFGTSFTCRVRVCRFKRGKLETRSVAGMACLAIDLISANMYKAPY